MLLPDLSLSPSPASSLPRSLSSTSLSHLSLFRPLCQCLFEWPPLLLTIPSPKPLKVSPSGRRPPPLLPSLSLLQESVRIVPPFMKVEVLTQVIGVTAVKNSLRKRIFDLDLSLRVHRKPIIFSTKSITCRINPSALPKL